MHDLQIPFKKRNINIWYVWQRDERQNGVKVTWRKREDGSLASQWNPIALKFTAITNSMYSICALQRTKMWHYVICVHHTLHLFRVQDRPTQTPKGSAKCSEFIRRSGHSAHAEDTPKWRQMWQIKNIIDRLPKSIRRVRFLNNLWMEGLGARVLAPYLEMNT